MYRFENANQALIGMAREIMDLGYRRRTRGYDCIEIPHPVMIEIMKPYDRYINVPARKWNKVLPWAESLWMALGLNVLDDLPGYYVKNLYNFSDDGRTWRGGYGPRIRNFWGIGNDYVIGAEDRFPSWDFVPMTVDQILYVVKSFERDMHTRQAIIEIGDPAKDCFELNADTVALKVTKDYPCSRLIQFMEVGGALNATMYIRSNDILWGMSAVNIFNWTFMQEYIARLVGLPLGRFYYVANNLHVYEDKLDMLYAIAGEDPADYQTPCRYVYDGHITYDDFNDKLVNLFDYVKSIQGTVGMIEPHNDPDPMFQDWANVFRKYERKDQVILFNNPLLNSLYYEG